MTATSAEIESMLELALGAFAEPLGAERELDVAKGILEKKGLEVPASIGEMLVVIDGQHSCHYCKKAMFRGDHVWDIGDGRYLHNYEPCRERRSNATAGAGNFILNTAVDWWCAGDEEKRSAVGAVKRLGGPSAVAALIRAELGE